MRSIVILKYKIIQHISPYELKYNKNIIVSFIYNLYLLIHHNNYLKIYSIIYYEVTLQFKSQK